MRTTCPNCGAENQLLGTQCQNCQYRIPNTVTVVSYQVTHPDMTMVPVPPAPAPKKDRSGLIIALATLALLALCCVALTFLLLTFGPALMSQAGVPVLPVGYQPVVPTPAGANPDCPSLQDLRNLTGLDWTRVGGPSTNEMCTYAYNTSDYSYQPMILLPGWMTTTARQDGYVHIMKGDGSTVQSKATTIRLLAANPTLTSEVQTDLTRKYAPSAGYDASIVVCDDCAPGFSSSVAPTYAAPTVTGFTCTTITGGYVCKASTPTDFVVPLGWRAYAGIPAQWYEPGTDLGPQSQVSLYPQ